MDGKTQIQAHGRIRPVLPILPGVPERRTTDYVRHGTTTLFTALDVLSGNVTGECRGAHKAEDYPAFLKKVDRQSGKGKTLHIIADNYATHKTKEVRAYFETKGGCFVTHFIPAHSSWLN